MKQYIDEFIHYYNYPQDAVDEIMRIVVRLESERAFYVRFADIKDRFSAQKAEIGPYLEEVSSLAAAMGENEYTLHLVFVIAATQALQGKYKAAGIDMSVFRDTFADLKYKMLECMECKGVVGTFVASWYRDFFLLKLFGCGRFQYQFSYFDFADEFVTSSGRVIRRGDFVISIHIPSSGISLTDDVRMDSYKKAYEMFHGMFPDGIMVLRCGSWLLYPRHKEFLPEKSNILKFIDDFEMVNDDESESFTNAWRVFGHYADLPLEQWPADTSLRKAYVDWLKSGNKSGVGRGVILFDGEKILR